MNEQAQSEVVSYSLRECRRCRLPMSRTATRTGQGWHCEQCGRTTA